MSSYRITTHSKKQAKKLGVTIKPSKNKNKKIDVFNKDGTKLASIGAVGYKDYGTYMETDKQLADKRRRLYRIRHKSNADKKGTTAYWAREILW